jgi:hypothetical protein
VDRRLTLARERDEEERAPESNPDNLGPGAALDEAVELGLGVQPGEKAPGTLHAAPAADIHEEHEPSEHSYWPVLVAASVLVISIGFLTHVAVAAIGSALLMVTLVGWFREPWVS